MAMAGSFAFAGAPALWTAIDTGTAERASNAVARMLRWRVDECDRFIDTSLMLSDETRMR